MNESSSSSVAGEQQKQLSSHWLDLSPILWFDYYYLSGWLLTMKTAGLVCFIGQILFQIFLASWFWWRDKCRINITRAGECMSAHQKWWWLNVNKLGKIELRNFHNHSSIIMNEFIIMTKNVQKNQRCREKTTTKRWVCAAPFTFFFQCCCCCCKLKLKEQFKEEFGTNSSPRKCSHGRLSGWIWLSCCWPRSRANNRMISFGNRIKAARAIKKNHRARRCDSNNRCVSYLLSYIRNIENVNR